MARLNQMLEEKAKGLYLENQLWRETVVDIFSHYVVGSVIPICKAELRPYEGLVVVLLLFSMLSATNKVFIQLICWMSM
ncbi:hypothetical protein SASPL_123613 [Salvia splendens]|uniref:Uncharacterized protein n=1 Tax=Salvia splendens TaxID=180675 RepID=A0A8X8ZU50_SALSN|nr:hypothetical protein SASPL_123613 [Salvia splendens]